MKNIACYLILEDGSFKPALLPMAMLVDLARSLRENGKESLGFTDHSVEVEGLYIPGRGTKHSLMALPNMGE